MPAPVPVPESQWPAAVKGGAARVLVLCSHEFERAWLGELLRRHRVTFSLAVTWAEGSGRFRDCRPHVVICEADLPDAGWKEVLEQISLLKSAPRLIVISSQASESLWAEVLNLGGYDVLPMPLVEDEVMRVVALAWHNFKNERDRRRKSAGQLRK